MKAGGSKEKVLLQGRLALEAVVAFLLFSNNYSLLK